MKVGLNRAAISQRNPVVIDPGDSIDAPAGETRKNQVIVTAETPRGGEQTRERRELFEESLPSFVELSHLGNSFGKAFVPGSAGGVDGGGSARPPPPSTV